MRALTLPPIPTVKLPPLLMWLRRLGWQHLAAYLLITIIGQTLFQIALTYASIAWVDYGPVEQVYWQAELLQYDAATLRYILDHDQVDPRQLDDWLSRFRETYTAGVTTDLLLVVRPDEQAFGGFVGKQTVARNTPVRASLSAAERALLSVALDGETDTTKLFRMADDNRLTVATPVNAVDGRLVGAVLWRSVVEPPTTYDAGTMFWESLGYLVPTYLASMGFTVATGVVFSAWLAYSLHQRLRRLAQAADDWSQGDFAHVAAVHGHDEIGRLARRFNHMATQLQAHMQTQQELAALEERNRIARDLHDSVKQHLFGAMLQTKAAYNQLPDALPARANVASVQTTLQQAQRDLTTLIYELRPLQASEQPLAEALADYVANWTLRTGIAADFHAGGDGDAAAAIQQTLYRVMQEALANVLRHSRASRVTVTLTSGADGLCLTLEDNGVGFVPSAKAGRGIGLHTMRERVQGMGGTFTLTSAPGKGTRVVACCPAVPAVPARV